MTEGPLEAEDLGAATEGIHEDIQMARNKLRHQTNLIVLAETKNGLSHRVQCGGVGAPLIPQIRHGCHVVHEEGDGLVPKNRKEP